MLLEQFTEAAATAGGFSKLDEISRLAWRALAEGHLSDEAASGISEAVEARRAVLKGQQARKALSVLKAAPARRRPVSPDKAASLARRRRLAASGAIPPQLAAQFTLGEVAALSVIARECQRRGQCTLPIDAIAAIAGVSRSTVQNALRLARRLDLLSVTERRRRGQRSDTNVVAVLSQEWRAWLRLHRAQKNRRHEYPIISFPEENPANMPRNVAFPVCSVQNLAAKHNMAASHDTRKPTTAMP